MNLRTPPLWAISSLCACALLTALPASAQDPVPPVTLARLPRTATLADALGTLPPGTIPDGAVLFCVGADRVSPKPPPVPLMGMTGGPDQIPPPDSQTDDTGVTVTPTDPLGVLALRYDRSLQTFGHVQAFAPSAMTVLNTDPNLANLPLADLITQSPLPFLLGTLTSDQWRKLTDTGLGFADLSADQQGLLRTALPTSFKVAPTATAQPPLNGETIKKWTPDDWQRFNQEASERQKVRDSQTQTVPADMLARDAQLRVFLKSEYVLDVPGQSGYGLGLNATDNADAKPGLFEFVDTLDRQTQQGQNLTRYIKGDFPNTPKESALRWDRRELRVKISLAGLKSVDDLVIRLAQATGLELYADPNYGRQTLTVLGRSDALWEARDVMQALTLCVCGTWRQVGPAYLLTDDLQGLAVRQAQIKDYVDTWSDRLRHASEGIGDHLQTLHWAQTLPPDPNEPALSDSLRKQIGDASTNRGSAQIVLQDLPPAIQTALRTQLQKYGQGDDLRASATKILASLTPQTKVQVQFTAGFVLNIPAFGSLPLDMNPYRPRSSPQTPGDPFPPSQAPTGRITLTETRRVALCAPATPQQARDVVVKLASMGFNTLFCDVPVIVSSDSLRAILAAAVDQGSKHGVAVFAATDVFCWRHDGLGSHPSALPDGLTDDRTLSGETLGQAVQHRLDVNRFHDPIEKGASQSLGQLRWVSPADPAVRARLVDWVRSVAIVPGLAGLAFQNTAPPGYLGGGDTGSPIDIELGYTFAQRLSYLRANHSDPIDIGSQRDTSLYLYGGDSPGASLDATLPTFRQEQSGWDKWRGIQAQAVLADLWTTAHQANPTLPLWMREQRIGFTYDPWTDPKMPDKVTDLRSEGNALGQRATAATILVPTFPGWTGHLDFLVSALDQFRREFGNGKATGILLDLIGDDSDADPVRLLDRIAPLFAPSPKNAPASGTITP